MHVYLKHNIIFAFFNTSYQELATLYSILAEADYYQINT